MGTSVLFQDVNIGKENSGSCLYFLASAVTFWHVKTSLVRELMVANQENLLKITLKN